MCKKRILHVIVGGEFTGGIEKYLLRYYSMMNREKLSFDFAFCVNNSMSIYMNEPIFKDSVFYNLSALTEDHRSIGQYIKLIKKARTILRRQKYDIIEVHSGSLRIQMVWILCCIGFNIPIRIAHSHSMPPPRRQNFIKIFVDNSFRKAITSFYTSLFSCSKDAGSHLFGKQGMAKSKYHLIKNTIEVEKYTFSPETRDKYRKALSLRDKFVILQIGYFEKVKNHMFTIDVFANLIKLNPNCLLVFCGDGSLKKEIQKKVNQLGIDNSVLFLGFRNDIEKILQAADCLVLPSLQEGFSYVILEAQVTDMPIICSETVPKDADVTGKCIFLPLVRELWIKEILKKSSYLIERKNLDRIIREQGYDISGEAKKLEAFYVNGEF